MLRLLVFMGFVGLIAAQAPWITCASTTCIQGAACKEVYYPDRGVVQAECLKPAQVPRTNEVCRNGQVLLVQLTGQRLSQANCGRSLNRVDCPSGYYCNIHPADAYAVCCPGPYTTPTPAQKPGRCPAPSRLDCLRVKNCNGDSSCPGDEKCCRNRCGGYHCSAPVSVPQTCSNHPCPPGQKCIMQAINCVRAPCPSALPTCVPIYVPAEKKGQCPPPDFGICAFQCYGDASCAGTLKCCRTACGGTTCQAPVGTLGYPIEKQEVRCPIYPAYVDPSPQCQTPPDCDVSNINSCRSGLVCCSTPCGVRCVNPDISG